MSDPHQHDDLHQLNRQIARLETDLARLEVERRAAAKLLRRLAARRAYLAAASRVRAPSATMPAWPWALLTVGPLLVGIVVFIALSMTFGSWALALAGFLFGALAALALLVALLYYPGETWRAATAAEVDSQHEVEAARLAELVGRLTDCRRHLADLEQQRHALATGDKLQRAMLLQRPWKTMRGEEWEDYVVEVCRTLGANVQRTRSPLPADHRSQFTAPAVKQALRRATENPLVVTFSPRRVATAAASGIRPFHTAAVQELINGLAQQGCDATAIVTNARLTVGSQQLATSRNCTLIGEEDFPDFVLGKISL